MAIGRFWQWPLFWGKSKYLRNCGPEIVLTVVKIIAGYVANAWEPAVLPSWN